MPYYAIVEFKTKEEAEAFLNEKDETIGLNTTIEEKFEHDYKTMYEDVRAVVDNADYLTAEQKQQINVKAIIMSLFEYEDEQYNEYIKELALQQVA